MFMYLSLPLYLPLSLLLSSSGQVMSPHHFDQMSQRSQDSRVALQGRSLNAFVIVFVFVFVIVIVIVFVFVIVIAIVFSFGQVFEGAL